MTGNGRRKRKHLKVKHIPRLPYPADWKQNLEKRGRLKGDQSSEVSGWKRDKFCLVSKTKEQAEYGNLQVLKIWETGYICD